MWRATEGQCIKNHKFLAFLIFFRVHKSYYNEPIEREYHNSNFSKSMLAPDNF